ncbi:PARP-domain-containing protein [Flagelloscypha sp. PMI_526]|nr:PARP-domain-containing protein [Flagelloscypha sp. PMI_526]
MDQDEPDEPPAKMVTVLKRGRAPVDPMSGKVDSHQVYDDGTTVWDCMLNQTDISGGNNKNKFYVIQLLHSNGSNASMSLFTRWGRVGENGQKQEKGPMTSAGAIAAFKKQFTSKTGVAWEDKVGMLPKKGKYVWLERDFNDDAEPETSKKVNGDKPRAATPDSTLEPEIQEFAKLIFSTALIDKHLSSMDYDARKLPLGKLAKNTILSGFSVLKKLADVINKDELGEYSSKRAAYEGLTSAYYSIIPHDFGRNPGRLISTAELLKKELDLVDALGDMEIASKLIQSSMLEDAEGNPVNPLDSQFRSLALTRMDPVTRGNKEFKVLEKYVKDTHGSTHSHIKAKLLNAFKVERAAEEVAWKNAGWDSTKDGERLLLWHGSRTTNFAGILKQGLRIAPPEAPVTGYMFGKGVYFADMMSKSAGYCYSYLSDSIGVLLLCEVAVAPFYERRDAEYDAAENCQAAGKMATKGLGRTQPRKWKDAGEALGVDELKGCHMPDGPGDDDFDPQAYLQYNEYIVYDVSQIKLKYLLMVKM